MTKKTCTTCKQEKEDTDFFNNDKKRKRAICKKCDIKRRRECYIKHRLLIIEHYTKGKMTCSQCQESRIECLDIDHINGGGTQERKLLKNTTGVYLKIIRDNFPTKYRILCRNCNWIEYLIRLGIKTKQPSKQCN
jgi:hypothetical protein